MCGVFYWQSKMRKLTCFSFCINTKNDSLRKYTLLQEKIKAFNKLGD